MTLCITLDVVTVNGFLMVLTIVSLEYLFRVTKHLISVFFSAPQDVQAQS